MRYTICCVLGILVLTSGCARNRLHSENERQSTIGIVQREITVGMYSTDVIAALGSPNIVRRQDGKEVFVYDKIATEASYKNSSTGVSGSVGAAGMAGDALLLGGVGASHNRGKGASATTQKTLTVIIRFDANDRVESFDYHTSTF
ncbi:MAG: hypothetical protein AMXMBFR84_20600 [Candidatus Hydrogenedentota bacterium]